MRKCLDLNLLCRDSSLMVFHGLPTKGRPFEVRYETKTFNRNSGRTWILVKEPLNFILRDVFHPYFSSFLKPLKLFAKVLRYGFAVQKFKSDGLTWSSNKKKTVRSP